MKKITIVTSGHPPIDERIFYKIGSSLQQNGFNVSIVCSNLDINTEKNGIVLTGFDGNLLNKTQKISRLQEFLNKTEPDLLICCEPITILAAHKYKKRSGKNTTVLSDITEWYPENVAFKLHGFKRIIVYLQLFLFNIYSVNFADGLIIGEVTKKRRYDFIAPFKPKLILGYYPVLEYFKYCPPPLEQHQLTLGYAGVITFERGIADLLNIASEIAVKHPELKIKLKIAGRFQYKEEEEIFRKKAAGTPMVNVEFCPWVEYPQISTVMKDMDICFDLRKKTFIYRNSLPIKIFEYMACGKPIIYSDIKPIRKELNVTEFGFLINPDNKDEIIDAIEIYIKEPALLQKHSQQARRAAEEKYNWKMIEGKLLKFVRAFAFGN